MLQHCGKLQNVLGIQLIADRVADRERDSDGVRELDEHWHG